MLVCAEMTLKISLRRDINEQNTITYYQLYVCKIFLSRSIAMEVSLNTECALVSIHGYGPRGQERLAAIDGARPRGYRCICQTLTDTGINPLNPTRVLAHECGFRCLGDGENRSGVGDLRKDEGRRRQFGRFCHRGGERKNSLVSRKFRSSREFRRGENSRRSRFRGSRIATTIIPPLIAFLGVTFIKYSRARI